MNYILHNAHIITMDDTAEYQNTDLLVTNGKIARIAPHIEPYGIPVKDCTGKHLIPGLIDSHVHMDSSEITEMLLACGITSCRNMWGFPETQTWRREIESGKRFGARVYSTGPLIDGETYWEGSLVVRTPEEAEKAVVDTINDGYEFVKTYPSIPRAAFLCLMDVANNLGIKVMGHGNYSVTFKELAKLGYYTLEHSSCLPENDEDILMLAESGMWFCPTLVVGRTIEEYVHKNGDLKTTYHYDSMNDYWKRDWEKVTAWRKSLHRYDNLDYEAELERARLFVSHSDKILLGTDVPNPGVTGGYSVYEELVLMSEIFGMSPYRVLRTATVNAARCIGISEQKGRLKVGMDADVLVLDRDPLKDIKNAQSYCAVIKEGDWYDKSEMDQVLEKVKHYSEDYIQPLM